jgi:hypothetical protein
MLLLLILSASANAGDVTKLPGYAFKYSIETTASKETIWRLWSDVKNWKKYDTILEFSYLENDTEFAAGAIGYVKAKDAPKTKFELIEVNTPISFVESLKLPLFSSLELKRYFETNDNGKTTFTHEIGFKGPFRWLMYAVVAGTFKKETPLVMSRLKAVAEKEEPLEIN